MDSEVEKPASGSDRELPVEAKASSPTEEAPVEQKGASPILFGLIFVGILLIAVLAMLLITLGDTKETPAPATLDPIAQEGKALFLSTGKCDTCHAAEGRKSGVGPRLSTNGSSDASLRSMIRNGRGAMPGNAVLSEDDITKIITYLKAIRAAAAEAKT